MEDVQEAYPRGAEIDLVEHRAGWGIEVDAEESRAPPALRIDLLARQDDDGSAG